MYALILLLTLFVGYLNLTVKNPIEISMENCSKQISSEMLKLSELGILLWR